MESVFLFWGGGGLRVKGVYGLGLHGLGGVRSLGLQATFPSILPSIARSSVRQSRVATWSLHLAPCLLSRDPKYGPLGCREYISI